MANRIYTYDSNDGATIYIFPSCLKCGKFLKKGVVLQNSDGEVKCENWICKKCGVVKPDYEIL